MQHEASALGFLWIPHTTTPNTRPTKGENGYARRLFNHEESSARSGDKTIWLKNLTDSPDSNNSYQERETHHILRGVDRDLMPGRHGQVDARE